MSLTEDRRRATTPAIINEDPLFDTNPAAQYLGLSVPTLERWRRSFVGPDWIKMGGLVKYRKSALNRYLEECTRQPRRRNKKPVAAA